MTAAWAVPRRAQHAADVRGRAVRLPAPLRRASGGRGSCPRCLRAARPFRSSGRTPRSVPTRRGPPPAMPTIRWLSRRATTRTKPSLDSSVIARPLAANGKHRADAVQPGLGRLRRRAADDDQLGVGETHGGNRGRHEMPALAGDDLGHHFALRHRAVGQHRLTGQVADRPDIAHRRAALVVDAHGAAVHVEHQGLHSPALGARPPPDGDQDLIGRQCGLFALRVADAHRVPARVQSLHGAAQMQLHARAAAVKRPPAWRVPRRRPAERVATPRPPSLRRPACDTRCRVPARCSRRRRRPGASAACRRQGFGRRDDAPAEGHRRQRHRLRTRREQQVFADDAQRLLPGSRS